MQLDLTGQRILVTGGSRGIGAALVKALQAAGATVAVHYHRAQAAAEALAAPGLALQADLGDPVACAALFENAVQALGGLDTLVNNAGLALHAPDSADDSAWLSAWQRTLSVNLQAAAILSRLAIRQFGTQDGGRLIHIASRAAFRGDTPDYLAYAASKGGMVALHRSIARGYGKQNIKSFLIAPGFVRTDMAQDFFDEYGEDYALNDIALPKLTEPADLGPTVVLFASGLADHATGCTLDINAGSYVH
ncbi:MAG: SDR family oxidoreductase [Bacteroidota bacterium]